VRIRLAHQIAQRSAPTDPQAVTLRGPRGYRVFPVEIDDLGGGGA